MSEKTTHPDEKRRYPYKYRGTVINNVDPLKMGRVLVQCPDVLGPLLSSWAIPCMPMGGMGAGMFCVPPIGSCCWVEFEQGDPDFPILSGAYWGNAGEVPTLSQATPPGMSVLQVSTMSFNQFTISDMPGPSGGFMLSLHNGAGISISEAGVIITNGQGATITLVGPTVEVNFGALVVT